MDMNLDIKINPGLLQIRLTSEVDPHIHIQIRSKFILNLPKSDPIGFESCES